MHWLRSVLKWHPWAARQRREEDLDRELGSHLDLEAEEQQESGLGAEEARVAFVVNRSISRNRLADGVGRVSE